MVFKPFGLVEGQQLDPVNSESHGKGEMVRINEVTISSKANQG